MASTTMLASHSLAIAGMIVKKHITRIAFVNEAKEVVPPPVGFRLT